ncbi:transposase [Tindallia californiensis]|uniref:Transposase n=1 Tax=Tindallia californiensis TaxID=159292 RepID=A0A1H3JZ46_9FIRM|nr:transposase [Tindallia californiensis]SDY45192.1 Transposase [Tindallia californiensis]
MARYSESFKISIMQKMMPPENQKVSTIAQETGMSEATLYKWKKEAKAKGIVIPDGETNAEQWSTQDKFQVVLETASLNETELAEYCRKKGLYVEQVQSLKNACLQANGGVAMIMALDRAIRNEGNDGGNSVYDSRGF